MGDYDAGLGAWLAAEGAVLQPEGPQGERQEVWALADGWVVITEGNATETREMLPAGPGHRDAVVLYGSLLTVVSALLNLLLLVVSERRRRRVADDYGANPPPALVMNAAGAQLLLALVIVPIQVKTEHAGGWVLGPTVCRGFLFGQVLLVAGCVWSLFGVTLDRFLYVLAPLSYARRAARRPGLAAGALAAGGWLAAAATLVPLLLPLGSDPDYILDEVCAISMDKRHAFLLAFAAFFAPAVMTALVSVGLIITVVVTKVQQARLRKGDVKSPVSSACCLCPDVTYATYAEYRSVGRVTATVLIVNISLLAMWAPFYVTNLRVPFCSGLCIDPTLWSLFLWLGYTSTALTPLLWFLDRELRRECKAVIRCEPRPMELPAAAKAGSWYFMETTDSKAELRSFKV